MSNTFDLAATTLGLTREELLEAFMYHIDNTTAYEHFYPTDDDAATGTPNGRVCMRGHLPHRPREVTPANTGYLELTDLEDEDGAPLPSVFVKVTFEVVDESVPTDVE